MASSRTRSSTTRSGASSRAATRRVAAVALGPVQMLVLGLPPEGIDRATLAELARLREGDAVRVVDVLIVRKDVDGELEAVRTDEPAGAAPHGGLVGALT